jgi:hypothetical protein
VSRRIGRPGWTATLGLVTGLTVAAGVAYVGAGSADGRIGWLAASAVAVGGPLAAWIAARRRALVGLAAAHIATTAGLLLIGLVAIVPHHTEARSGAPLVRKLEERGLAGHVAGACGVTRSFSLEFYLGRSFPRLAGVSDLPKPDPTDPEAVWLVPTATLPSLRERAGSAVELVVVGPNLSAVRFRAPAAAKETSS